METIDTPLQCAEHPNVETYLRCGRCEKPICPKCLVYTPVGTRCRDCANIKKSPVYDVSGAQYLKASAVGLGLGLGLGFVWAFIPQFAFFSLWIVLFLGFAVGELIGRSVNRKHGPGLMAIAVLTVILAFVVSRLTPAVLQLLGSGVPLGAWPQVLVAYAARTLFDPIGWILVGLGAALAASRLR
jgi:hypothetical protein